MIFKCDEAIMRAVNYCRVIGCLTVILYSSAMRGSFAPHDLEEVGPSLMPASLRSGWNELMFEAGPSKNIRDCTNDHDESDAHTGKIRRKRQKVYAFMRSQLLNEYEDQPSPSLMLSTLRERFSWVDEDLLQELYVNVQLALRNSKHAH